MKPVIASLRSNPETWFAIRLLRRLAMTIQRNPSLRACEAIQKPGLQLDCFAGSQ